MSSGHASGLQSGAEFKEIEQQVRAARAAELAGADEEVSGRNAGTVYRDKRGRKLDMLTQFMEQQEAKDGKKKREEQEQFEWGRGAVQKRRERDFQEELREIQAQPFARYRDDEKLNQAAKEEIHADDPMAAYMLKKRRQERAAAGGGPARPEYKGPPPPPNRYGLRPGYRWDGHDRGNGFEARVLGKAADRQVFNERKYNWSVSDM